MGAMRLVCQFFMAKVPLSRTPLAPPSALFYGVNMNKIGPISGLILLGGGQLLRRLTLWSKEKNLPVKVLTAPRHAKEKEKGHTLERFLIENDIESLIVEDICADIVRDFIGDPDNKFMLSLGAAWIFKKAVIKNTFHNKLLNIHSTCLPKNRGGGGFSWKIMMGDRVGNCLIHLVDGGIDTGSIVAFDEYVFPSSARIPVDFQTVSVQKDFSFVTRLIEECLSGVINTNQISQPEYLSTYWPRLNTDLNAWLDWGWSAPQLERFICAFDDPYPGARTFLGKSQVRIKKTTVTSLEDSYHPFQHGLIYRAKSDCCFVATKEGSLIIESVLDENGQEIIQNCKVGDRFSTPIQHLEAARSRPKYTPLGLK